MSKALVVVPQRRIRTVSIDALVGNYAALGARVRRKQRQRRWFVSVLTVCLAIAAGLIGATGWSPLASFEASMRAEMDNGLARVDAERTRLELDRVEVDTSIEQLKRQLEEFAETAGRWEAQRATLIDESETIRRAIAALEDRQDELMAAADVQSTLADDLGAISAERERLTQRWEDFLAQDDAVETELAALLKQRQAVEAQRLSLERQKAELEAMLFGGEAADEESRAGSDVPDAVPTSALEAQDSRYELDADRIAAWMEQAALSESRAGIRLGDGMSVSLGLTRSASINGIAQIHESIDLGNISGSLNLSADALGSIGGIVVQNGGGNYIGSQPLDTVSSGYGTIIQNSLDDQTLRTETIYDIRIEDVSSAINGLAADQALGESLRFQ